MTMSADRLREILYHLEAAYELIEVPLMSEDNYTSIKRMDDSIGNYVNMVTGNLHRLEQDKMREYMDRVAK